MLIVNDNSRFCFKFTKPAQEHRLQVLPARTSLIPDRLAGLETEHKNLTTSN
jgi:hypothetical protein